MTLRPLAALVAVLALPALAADPAPATVASRCAALMADLEARRLDEAGAHFDADMRRGLPRARLGQVLSQLEAQLGAWKSTARRGIVPRDGKQVCLFDLGFERAGLTGVVTVDPATLEVAGLFFQPGAPPPAPRAADAPREVELRIGPPGKEMPGLLALPEGKGPFPAAVLLAGSGPRDRDSTIGNKKPLRDLADGLARRGIATLRWDKRTFARKEDFDVRRGTVEEEVLADAAAALRLLAARPEVDAARLSVVGHSLGAFLAPEVAGRGTAARKLVLLAAPGRPTSTLALEQLERQGPATAELVRQLRAVADGSAAEGAMVLGAPASYWRDLDRRDAFAAAKKLGLPILALRGEKDAQVAAVDLEAWRKVLAGIPGSRAESLPGLDHVFCAEGSATVAPEAIARVADFLLAP